MRRGHEARASLDVPINTYPLELCPELLIAEQSTVTGSIEMVQVLDTASTLTRYLFQWLDHCYYFHVRTRHCYCKQWTALKNGFELVLKIY